MGEGQCKWGAVDERAAGAELLTPQQRIIVTGLKGPTTLSKPAKCLDQWDKAQGR